MPGASACATRRLQNCSRSAPSSRMCWATAGSIASPRRGVISELLLVEYRPVTVPSFHDANLVAYEVDCEARRIRLIIRPEGEKTPQSVTFRGVQGYHFQHDAFSNIIYALQEVAVDAILADHAGQIAEKIG